MRRTGLAVLLSAALCFCAPSLRYGHDETWAWICIATLLVGTPLWLFWLARFLFRMRRRMRTGEENSAVRSGLREGLARIGSVTFLTLYLLACVNRAQFVHEKIERSRMAGAHAAIRNMDLACTKMITDAEKKSLLGFFSDAEALRRQFGTYANAWTFVIPELLRNGCNTKLDLKPGVRKKLAPGYMPVGNDPWGRPYHFFAGPLDAKAYDGMALATRFRSYRKPARTFYIDRNGYQQTSFYYDTEAKQEETARLGTDTRVPEPDGLPGFPAPADLPVYIWSMGADGKSCQRIGAGLDAEDVKVGPSPDCGDDINNWDAEWAWQSFYGGEQKPPGG